MTVLVLDGEAVSQLATDRPSPRLTALLLEARRREREVLVAAVQCAEVARGRKRTQQMEALVRRHDRAAGERPAIRIVDTDLLVAKRVGAILTAARKGSEHLADAHVVAVAVGAGGALVATSDPDDIVSLAAAVPAIRIVVREI